MKSRTVVFFWNGFISVALVLSLWSLTLMLRDGSSDQADAGDKPRINTSDLLEELEAAFDARRTLPPVRIDKAPEVPPAYRPEPANVVAPPKADKLPQPVSDNAPLKAADVLEELEAAFDARRTLPPRRIDKALVVPVANRAEPANVATPPQADKRLQPASVAQNAGIDGEASVKPLPPQASERRQDVAANTRFLIQPVQPSIKTTPFRPEQRAVNETGGEVAVVPPPPERAPFRQAHYVPGPVENKPPLAPAPVEEAPAKPGFAARASMLPFLAKVWQPTEPASRRLPAPSTDQEAVARREHRDTRAATSTANPDMVPTASLIPNSAKTDAKRTPPPKWTPASCQPNFF